MLSFVLALAIFNLGLGYAAAVALAEPPVWSGLALRWPARRRSTASAERTAAAEEKAAASELPASGITLSASSSSPQPIIAGLDELPADWLAQLAAQGIVAESFVEATAHILRLEVGSYRDQLVAGECQARQLLAVGDAAGLCRLADQLRFLNQDWLDKQTAGADLLGQRAGRLGSHEQAAASLEQVLLDQAAQIRAACGVLETLHTGDDPESQGKSLIEQTAMLLAQTHALRDRIIDLLATLMNAGSEIVNCPLAVQRDAATGLTNRIGLERLLAAWWQGDEQRTRPISAILLDLDRCGRINQRYGTAAGDHTIAAIGKLIEDSLDKDRGFERLVRMSGQTFLILLGDAGPHQALSTAERLRQTIEATTFEEQLTEFDLTVSCGVIEVGHTESTLDLVRRAEETLRFAKKAGRNRCALDKGTGPAMIDPPQFPVKSRVIALGEAALPAAQTVGTEMAKKGPEMSNGE